MNFNLSTGLGTIDPTFQHSNWTFPVDASNQHQRSIAGPTGSKTISPQDSSSTHLTHHDILNIIRQASEWDLSTSGNAAYMRLELTLARVTNEKTQLEGLKRSVEEEVIRLQSRLQAIEEINNKLACAPMTLPQAVCSSNQTWSHLPPTKDPPSPLNQRDFDDVKFWTKSSWNVYERAQRGATNGNAKKTKKRGRPEKETPNDDCDSLEPNTTHIYLETEDGVPVSKALITQQGQKIRSLWATLGRHGLAPMVWSEADSLAVRFVDSAMLNDPRFHYLRLCDDNWKLKHWISKNYPSWVRNHLVPDGAVKAKKEALDNVNLFKITPDPSDNELKMTPDPSDVVSHEESSDALEDITMNSSSPSHPMAALNIVDPLRDDDADESTDNQTGVPTDCPEATTQSPTSELDLHTVPPITTDARVDEALAPMTTGACEDSMPAPATVGETLLSTSAPPVDVSLTERLPQLADGPALKKRKVAAVVSDSISDKNLCRQDWLKSHEGGTEDKFKAYWLGLPEEEIMRWKQAASLQRKARNERKKKKA